MKKNERRALSMLLTAILLYGSLQAQNDTIPVADNLVSTGMPPLPASIISDVSPYSNIRRAYMVTWHPVKKEMLITTRFENTYQLHWVKMPGGDRKQVTFFDEPVATASFNPVNGELLFRMKKMQAATSLRSYTSMMLLPENQPCLPMGNAP